ncbi:hypothetical protein [Polluticoccus soli]|nr:hypothetical protein [Flavipsychrobacter sp. JY13-12]
MQRYYCMVNRREIIAYILVLALLIGSYFYVRSLQPQEELQLTGQPAAAR